MLICSREVGQLGSSAFEAAQTFPISEYSKEPMLTFSREGASWVPLPLKAKPRPRFGLWCRKRQLCRSCSGGRAGGRAPGSLEVASAVPAGQAGFEVQVGTGGL